MHLLSQCMGLSQGLEQWAVTEAVLHQLPQRDRAYSQVTFLSMISKTPKLLLLADDGLYLY